MTEDFITQAQNIRKEPPMRSLVATALHKVKVVAMGDVSIACTLNYLAEVQDSVQLSKEDCSFLSDNVDFLDELHIFTECKFHVPDSGNDYMNIEPLFSRLYDAQMVIILMDKGTNLFQHILKEFLDFCKLNGAEIRIHRVDSLNPQQSKMRVSKYLSPLIT